ncbi:MAG: hypothetical protein ACLFV2_07860 [Desulfurivibrionaceae bacterium]
MKINDRKNTIFYLLQQDGPFATLETPLTSRTFTPNARKRSAAIHRNGLTTKYRIIRNQIQELLDISSFREIYELMSDHSRKKQVARRAYMLIGNMFGIEGNEREIISRVNSYSRTADAVIRYLQRQTMAPYSSYLDMTNEVDIITSPVDLLLMIFDDRYHLKARFEAKRKLILMNLAGSIDQRERETDIEAKFAEFLNFLNEFVWSHKTRIGELEPAYLLSSHDRESFACSSLKILSPEEAKNIVLTERQKLTLIKRRMFEINGRKIPVYVSIRKKSPEAKVLKLLRKGEENPAVAVDDELGLMGVVDSLKEVKLFHKHLTQSAVQAHSFMTLEDISDSLHGQRYQISNEGSCPQTSMLKFFARMGGMRIEFIIHTNKSYLNYIYQRDVSHHEYEVKRIIDSGAADLLFPKELYDLDMQEVKKELIHRYRHMIEWTN